MKNKSSDRRDFLKGALVGTSVAISSSMSSSALAKDEVANQQILQNR